MWGVMSISFEARYLGHCPTKHGTSARGSPRNAAGQTQGTRDPLSRTLEPCFCKGAKLEARTCESRTGRSVRQRTWPLATPRGGSTRKFATLR